MFKKSVKLQYSYTLQSSGVWQKMGEFGILRE
jgi:hypothetical protein